jgi:excisionase family DNA binding protein
MTAACFTPSWALEAARAPEPTAARTRASSATGPLRPDQLPSNHRAVVGRRLDPLLTVAEAASLLHVSPRTLRRLTGSGALRALRVGRSVRLRVADIERFLAAGEAG